MSTPTEPQPDPQEQVANAPLLRDPPAPPGYIDPLEGVAALEEIVNDTREARRTPGLSGRHNA